MAPSGAKDERSLRGVYIPVTLELIGFTYAGCTIHVNVFVELKSMGRDKHDVAVAYTAPQKPQDPVVTLIAPAAQLRCAAWV